MASQKFHRVALKPIKNGIENLLCLSNGQREETKSNQIK